MEELKGEETQEQILAALAQAVWPQKTPTRPEDIIRELRALAGREELLAREPLLRASRFVEIAAEWGDSSRGRYAAREAHGVIAAYLRGDFKGLSWAQAFEELGKANAVRRAAWTPDLYVDVNFSDSYTSGRPLSELDGFPHRNASGDAFQMRLWPEGHVYEPTEEDKAAKDWQRD